MDSLPSFYSLIWRTTIQLKYSNSRLVVCFKLSNQHLLVMFCYTLDHIIILFCCVDLENIAMMSQSTIS